MDRNTVTADTSDLATPYQIRLEKFEGPLDLLLHLIKKNEVDIYDIPISTITNQYLEYIRLLKELNLEIAGEFLVMASTLLQIKSQMLLPSPDPDDLSEEEEDPRAELIRRLLEYQKYREAADLFENMDQRGRDIFACRLGRPEEELSEPEEQILEVELFELIEAFRAVLSRIPVEKFHEVAVEPINMADRINDLLSLLQEKKSIRFGELFLEESTREEVIATFLAILELCKSKMIKTIQAGLFGEILITAAVIEEDKETMLGVEIHNV